MAKELNLNEILESMTIKEKASQLLQLAPFFFNEDTQGEITGPMADLGIEDEDIINAGSVLGISGAEEMIKIQRSYLEKNKNNIPLMIMADIIHGYRTIFPVPLALGCSWDMSLAEKVARVSAKEASAGGVHVTFSPMVDLVRDPRWGRVMESTGEDTYLNSLFARAFVRGYQGNDISKDGNIAACVKHFAAYGAPEAGRDYNTVDMSERILRESYLPAYKAALDEGCKMLMTSFNTVNSVPPSGNQWLMRDILRKEWGFDGVTISDWGAIRELIPHGVAEDEKEAAEKAIKAGVDIEMMTSNYTLYLEKLVKEEVVEEGLIDEAVLRILKLKEELGLFEDPFRGADAEKEKQLVLCDEHRKAAREAAKKSIVLLKNNNTLPLKANENKIAVIGPFADEHAILGPWSWQGKFEETVSLKEGLSSKINEKNLLVAKGCEIEKGNKDGFTEAIEAAINADTIILALGEHHDMSGEGGSRAFIKLPEIQEKLAKEIFKLNKPTIVVLFNGRPLEIKDIADSADAVVEAWFPGTEGGNAITDVLFGDFNPSARLAMSFPYTVGQIPVYYNCFNTGRPREDGDTNRYTSHFIDTPNAPLYPFGYGLSYTEFKYSDFSINSDVLRKGEKILAKVKIKNIGSIIGEETAQLYIRDISGSVVRPVKELKAFEKITLNPGEEKEVLFEINEEMLKFHIINCEFKAEKGKFEVMVGKNSRDLMKLDFVY